ncbi:MAG: MFS transporter [Candidatus Diapherotrites archaeon]|nr:MFS transporter [Candidatus Diapherotrites archaeon]
MMEIKKYYILRFLSRLVFFLPIFVIFLQENGLSLTEIMVLQSIYSIVYLLLQIPTGAFADLFGRNRSIQISTAFLVIGSFLYSIGKNFTGFLIAEIAWAFASAFFYGADEAFVYDILKSAGREKHYKKVKGKIFGIEQVSSAIAFAFGGWLASMYMRLPFQITVLFYVIAFFVSLTLRETKRKQRFYIERYVKQIKNSVVFISRKKELKFLIEYAVVFSGFSLAAFWLFQPYMRYIGIPIVQFGILFASFSLVGSLGSVYAHKVEKRLGRAQTLYFMAILLGLSLMFMASVSFIAGVLFIYFAYFAYGFSTPVISDYTNKLTPSDKRATVASVRGMAQELFSAVLLPFIGVIADIYSVQHALLVSGVVVAVTCLTMTMIFYTTRG